MSTSVAMAIRSLRVTALVTTLVGCGAAQRSEPQARVEVSSDQTVDDVTSAAVAVETSATVVDEATEAPTTTDVCAAASGLVLTVPPEIAESFDGSTRSAGPADVTLRWCGEDSFRVDELRVGEQTRYAFGDEALLRHGQELSRRITGPSGTTAVVVEAWGHDEGGVRYAARAETRATMAPQFAAEQAACAARAGQYGPMGLSRRFGCVAPTGDGGTRCLADDECEGSCLADRIELTDRQPEGGACAQGELAHVHVGRCAPTTQQYGCTHRLTEVFVECLSPGRRARTRVICVD